MAEEETLFDLSLKKKKKKKRTPADFEASLAETAGQDDEVAVEQPPVAADAAIVESAGDAGNAPQSEDLVGDFSSLSKKKKKKKKPFDLAEMEEALPTEDKEVEYDTEKIEDVVPVDVNEDDFDMSLPSKKKKKKKVKIIEDSQMADDKDDEKEGVILSHGSFKQDSEREYTYEELLKRVVDIMREKNPDMVTGEKKRFVMKPPQVMRVGTKKSCFANFTDICKMLHRQPEHLLHFLLAELGTSGSIDGNNHLIIKGRFQQKQIENVLRKYIKEYVTCHTCRSPETLLQKDTRLYFLQCETCGSRCSVQSIKSGFQAVTGKRAAIRAKTA